MELREELRDRSKIQDWARKYDVDYDTPIENLVPIVKKRKYLTKSQLIEVSNWKVRKKRNTLRNVIENHPNDVKKMTRAAFRATVDDSIYYLYNQPRRDVGLRGIGVPMASAILHWFHEAPYPIWDRYAIWSVQLDESQYKNWFERWKVYVLFCRDIAKKYKVCMRTLDRALLRYGSAKMPRSC
jgi:hypothetical protein